MMAVHMVSVVSKARRSQELGILSLCFASINLGGDGSLGFKGLCSAWQNTQVNCTMGVGICRQLCVTELFSIFQTE